MPDIHPKEQPPQHPTPWPPAPYVADDVDEDEDELPDAQDFSLNANFWGNRVALRAAQGQHIEGRNECRCSRLVPAALQLDMVSITRSSLKTNYLVLKRVVAVEFNNYCDFHLFAIGRRTAELVRDLEQTRTQ